MQVRERWEMLRRQPGDWPGAGDLILALPLPGDIPFPGRAAPIVTLSGHSLNVLSILH